MTQIEIPHRIGCALGAKGTRDDDKTGHFSSKRLAVEFGGDLAHALELTYIVSSHLPDLPHAAEPCFALRRNMERPAGNCAAEQEASLIYRRVPPQSAL